MILDSSIKIELTKPEINAIHDDLKVLGVTKTLGQILKESHLIVEGNKHAESILKVFHPSVYLEFSLAKTKSDEPLRISSPENCLFSGAIRGLYELTKEHKSHLDAEFSKPVVKNARKQQKIIEKYYKKDKYYKDNRSIKLRLFLEEKLPSLKSKLFPPKKLVNASTMLEKSSIFEEISQKLGDYLDSKTPSRVLIDSEQIRLCS